MMTDYEALKKKVQELAERDWDRPALEARYRNLAAEGKASAMTPSPK